jgi:hypothetical protein
MDRKPRSPMTPWHQITTERAATPGTSLPFRDVDAYETVAVAGELRFKPRNAPVHRPDADEVELPPSSFGPPAEGEVELPVQYGTLATLDGTVVAQIKCDVADAKVIGRCSSAAICISDPFVHRVHAEIRWDADLRAHVIMHGEGMNGTFVSMQRISQPTRLIDGARIRIGKTELIYRRAWYPRE